MDKNNVCCKIFISYCHQDKAVFDIIERYFKNDQVWRTTFWFDKDLKKGQFYDENIKRNMYEADIILLMISHNFFNSTYILDVELPIALKRRKEGCIVIPIKMMHYNAPVNGTARRLVKFIERIQGWISRIPILQRNEVEQNDALLSLIRDLRDDSREVVRKKLLQELNTQENPTKSQVNRWKFLIKPNFYLSLPHSEQGRRKREELMEQIYTEKRHNSFPYTIVPDVRELPQIYTELDASNGNLEVCEEILKKYINQAFCSIHIVCDNNETHDLDALQASLCSKKGCNSIYWHLQPIAQRDINRVSGDFVTVYSDIFNKIISANAAREKELTELKNLWDTKVLLLASSQSEESEDLIFLEDLITDNPLCNVEISRLFPGQTVQQSQFQGGLVFYETNADIHWIKRRQKELLSASHRGVYISDPLEGKEADIQKIEDILFEKKTVIKGRNEMTERIEEFLIWVAYRKFADVEE